MIDNLVDQTVGKEIRKIESTGSGKHTIEFEQTVYLWIEEKNSKAQQIEPPQCVLDFISARKGGWRKNVVIEVRDRHSEKESRRFKGENDSIKFTPYFKKNGNVSIPSNKLFDLKRKEIKRRCSKIFYAYVTIYYKQNLPTVEKSLLQLM